MKTRHLLLGSFWFVASATATSAGQATVPAVDGNVASHSPGQDFAEWRVGGIQNRSTSARDWLIPLNPRSAGCASGRCKVLATYQGGASGVSTSIGYVVHENGTFVTSTGVAVSQGPVLEQKNLGIVDVAPLYSVLIVTKLAGATTFNGTNGGGMTSTSLAVSP